jgi:nitroreductase
MDVVEAIRGRRAVRDYSAALVEPGELAEVVGDAVWAPSGINLQPWCFFVLEDQALLGACSAEAKAHMLAQADTRPELAGLKGMLESPDFNIFYNAPALILVCATTGDEMALKDCCLAAQTLMLAAHARGLGTCWIGFAEAWLNTAAAKARLGIPAAFRPVAPLIIGHPKGATPATERRAPDVRRIVVGAE